MAPTPSIELDAKAARWRDLRVRLASALVMVPVAVAAILAGGLAWQVVLGAVAAGAVFEWAGLCGGRRAPGFLAAGTLYILLAYATLIALHAAPHGAANVLFVAITVSAGDIGAYLAGRLVGGPKLARALSPGKTWSGALGGLAAGVAAGLAIASAYDRPLATVLILAAILSVVAQAGDLLESAMKRRFGKKDSSTLIPGHGGLLDRLDGLLAAAPVAALWLAVRQGAFVWQ